MDSRSLHAIRRVIYSQRNRQQRKWRDGMKTAVAGILIVCLFFALSCREERVTEQQQPNPQPTLSVSSDSALFRLITRTQPFLTYPLFPNVAAETTGTLNGSTAHQPIVRVSMNATAYNALQNGRLPAGAKFPDGSIIFKEVKRTDRTTALYAVIYKERLNPLAEPQSGWLWAEYSPAGDTVISASRRGSGCIGCHSRDQGPQNDFVRTFERQR
jgi:hypothetical protein